MPQISFRDALTRLAIITGDYPPPISAEDIAEMTGWASLLNVRVREVWEMFDWNELCDITPITVIAEGNYKYFTIPDDKIFLAAYFLDPRLYDAGVPEEDVDIYANKFRVSTRAPAEIYVNLQKAAPDFLGANGYDKTMWDYISQAACELAYADILTQDGQLSKAAVRQQNGYRFANAEIYKQTRRRRGRIRMENAN